VSVKDDTAEFLKKNERADVKNVEACRTVGGVFTPSLQPITGSERTLSRAMKLKRVLNVRHKIVVRITFRKKVLKLALSAATR